MIINKEKQLLDTLARIEKNPKNLTAIRVFLSRKKGKSKNVNINFAYKVASNLSPILQTTSFGMKNSDLIIIGKNLSLSATGDIIEEIAEVLKKDDTDTETISSMFKTYNLEYDYDDFKRDIIKTVNYDMPSDKNAAARPSGSPEFTPDILDAVIRKLNGIDVLSFIRRQAVAKVIKGKKFEIMFKEYFLSIRDLNEKLIKDVDITSDYWLFRHFTEHLDKKMLSRMLVLPTSIRLPKISLNLNINTVFSKEFRTYTEKFASEKLIIEFQIVDILNNIDGYFKARDYLMQMGHKILIDCVTTNELDFIDIASLKPHYVKLIWNEDASSDKSNALIKELAFQIGGKKIILARADSDRALSFGTELGIEIYQGYYVDTINAVFSKTNCSVGNRCSLEKCANAKREITGSNREQCQNHPLLDRDPVLKNF